MVRVIKKQINRERLLSEGVSLLMASGYHGTGLKEILDAVNIPKGSFYNYFSSKEDFAAEVIQHYIEPFNHRLNAYLHKPGLDALPALQFYLEELIDDLEKAEFKGGCLLGNLMGEIGDTSDVCRDSLRSAVQRYRDLYVLALRRAQQQGHIRIDKSAEKMADLLLNGFQGALLRMKIEKSVAPLTDCCQELLGDYFRV
jgi:TetR/AcrR family transcriptional repressor of nem operon